MSKTDRRITEEDLWDGYDVEKEYALRGWWIIPVALLGVMAWSAIIYMIGKWAAS
jgi:hypothetical protein